MIGASPLDPDLPHVRADRDAHAIGRVGALGWTELEVVLGAEAQLTAQYSAACDPVIANLIVLRDGG